MFYELIDVHGGRLLASAATEKEILPVVRDFLATGDVSYLSDLALLFTDGEEQAEVIAEGNELAARALANTNITPVAA